MCTRLAVWLLVIAACHRSYAGLITLDDVERGEFTSSGTNFSGTDFMVIGESQTHSVPEYRSFLTFDLSGIVGTVVDASLHLQVDNYNATNSLDFSVYDFTLGNDAILGNALNSVDVFNDLGTGVLYGSASVNTVDNPVGETFVVALNLAAVADINAKIGQLFTVGFADDAITGNDANIRLDRDPSIRVNQLVLQTAAVPEPASLFLGCIGVAGLAASSLRRRSVRDLA